MDVETASSLVTDFMSREAPVCGCCGTLASFVKTDRIVILDCRKDERLRTHPVDLPTKGFGARALRTLPCPTSPQTSETTPVNNPAERSPASPKLKAKLPSQRFADQKGARTISRRWGKGVLFLTLVRVKRRDEL